MTEQLDPAAPVAKIKTPPPPMAPGSVVWLKSGSVRMVVERIEGEPSKNPNERPIQVIHVVWSKDGDVHRDTFLDYTLTTERP